MSDKPTPADIARANGAKSRGPVTPYGKARSSRNATRHGLRASQLVLLPEESRAEFQALLNSYFDQFQPQTQYETKLVSVMAATRWRLDRLVSIETNLITHKLESRREDIARFVHNPDGAKTVAWIFDSMSGGTALPLLGRYEGSLNRAYDRAFKRLQTLREESRTPTTTRTRISASPVETTPAP